MAGGQLSGSFGSSGSVRPPGPAGALVSLSVAYLLLAFGPVQQPVFGDEIPIVRNLLRFVDERTILPAMYNYPTFYSYMAAGGFAVAAAVRHLVTGLGVEELGLRLLWPIYGTAQVTVEIMFLRAFSVLAGLGVLLGTYFIGSRYGGRRVGFGAAVLVLASSTFLYRATLALPDILAAALATAAVAAAFRAYAGHEAGTRLSRWFVAAAALAGAAIATKYNAALAFVPVLSLAAAVRRRAGTDWLGVAARDAVRLGLVVGVAFLICTAGIFLAPGAYWEGFRFESGHVAEGQLYVDLGNLHFLWVPIRLLEVEGLVGLSYIAGIVWGLVASDRRTAPTLAFLVTFALLLLAVGTWRYTSIHYLLWVFPLLAVLAARCLADLTHRAPRGGLLFATIVAAIALPSLLGSAIDSWRWSTEVGNKVAAERWIEANLPAGSHLAHDGEGLPSIWNAEARRLFTDLLDRVPAPSAEIRDAVAQKPIYTGYLGFQEERPSAAILIEQRPEWVVTNGRLEPPGLEPPAGYGSQRLIDLHRNMAGFYEVLWSSGDYTLAREFADGPGYVMRLYRRVE